MLPSGGVRVVVFSVSRSAAASAAAAFWHGLPGRWCSTSWICAEAGPHSPGQKTGGGSSPLAEPGAFSVLTDCAARSAPAGVAEKMSIEVRPVYSSIERPSS